MPSVVAAFGSLVCLIPCLLTYNVCIFLRYVIKLVAVTLLVDILVFAMLLDVRVDC